jgi:hypothetical protein
MWHAATARPPASTAAKEEKELAHRLGSTIARIQRGLKSPVAEKGSTRATAASDGARHAQTPLLGWSLLDQSTVKGPYGA